MGENTNSISYIKEKGYLTLVADGVPLFRAPESIFEKYGPKDGAVISDKRLEECRKTCLGKAALQRAFYLLAKKDYTRAEMTGKLNTDPDVAEAVVQRLVELGYLDDEQYAQRRAARIAARGGSERKIIFTLTGEGVPRDTAREAAAAVCDDGANALAVVRKKYGKKLGTPEDIRKVVTALVNRGFSTEDAREAIRQALAEEENED